MKGNQRHQQKVIKIWIHIDQVALIKLATFCRNLTKLHVLFFVRHEMGSLMEFFAAYKDLNNLVYLAILPRSGFFRLLILRLFTVVLFFFLSGLFWCLVWQNSYVHSVFEQNVVIGGLGLSELIRRHVRTLICQVTLSGSWQVMIKFYLSALDHQTSPGKRHGRSIKSRPNDFSMRGFLYKKNK